MLSIFAMATKAVMGTALAVTMASGPQVANVDDFASCSAALTMDDVKTFAFQDRDDSYVYWEANEYNGDLMLTYSYK